MIRNPRNKRTKTGREECLAILSKLDRVGFSQYEMIEALVELGYPRISQSQISQDLDKVRERAKAAALEDAAILRRQQTERYETIFVEAYVAWMRSGSDGEKEVTYQSLRHKKNKQGEYVGKGKMLVTQIRKTREGRLPGAEYLNVMRGAIQGIRELWGLDAPKQVETKNLHGVAAVMGIPWEQLAMEIPIEVADEIEERIEKVKHQLPCGLKELNGEDSKNGEGSPNGS